MVIPITTSSIKCHSYEHWKGWGTTTRNRGRAKEGKKKVKKKGKIQKFKKNMSDRDRGMHQ